MVKRKIGVGIRYVKNPQLWGYRSSVLGPEQLDEKDPFRLRGPI